jgi:dTDP-glucose pyrophosphorylase
MKGIKTAIVPAAGEGKRINDLKFTRILPKAMLPVLDKPILHYIIQLLKSNEIETVYLIVGYKKDLIINYFGNGSDFGLTIKYVEQPQRLGIADAIYRVSKETYLQEPFIVVLGDSFFIEPELKGLIEIFWKNQAIAVEGVVVEDDVDAVKRACEVIVDKDWKIIDIIEKPKNPKSKLRGIGTYIFDPVVFDYIERTPTGPPRGEKEITNTLRLMSKTGKVYAKPIGGIEININTLADLVKANLYALGVH